MTTSIAAYPVRLSARLDPPLSRWRWLVKWFLALPHLAVLAVLWIGTSLTTFAAGVAILFTCRYPRALFDFNVGVMRWTWRVSFYAFSGLGTDRYPPFRLKPDARYPADFDVDYPERLSRGLVLVKWWLLAIPHYLIVALIAGGIGPHVGGVASILTLVGVVTLAIRGAYPESVFDLVIGLNRWGFRVLAYAALMRDEYPPFRLDVGPQEPTSSE